MAPGQILCLGATQRGRVGASWRPSGRGARAFDQPGGALLVWLSRVDIRM